MNRAAVAGLAVRIALAVLLVLLVDCVSATAIRESNGVKESVIVKGFLSSIRNGTYTNGSGISLTVSDASPDQQSIAILAGSVVELSKAAMVFATKQPTNSPVK